MPFEATNNRKKSDFPILERKSKLPIVAIKATSYIPIEANKEKLHIGSSHLQSCIVFRNICQGCFVADSCEGGDWPFTSSHTALENDFTDSNAIVILEGFMVSIIFNPDSGYYVFDSHARNSSGVTITPSRTGTFEFPLVVTAVMFQCILCCGGKFIRFREGGF